MRYVVAIKREARDTAPSDLLPRITESQDLELIGSIQFGRMIVDATEDTIDNINREFGSYVYVEPIISYEKK